MRNPIKGVVIAYAMAALFSVAVKPAAGQTSQAYKIRHTAAGKPDFSGIWQTLGTANWDLEAHAARPAPRCLRRGRRRPRRTGRGRRR